MTDDCIDCPEHYEGRAVDNSAWDGAAAMSKCANSDSPASCYNAICAGKKAGDPNLQSSHALPHHKAPGDPPNAAGVRNAMARLSQTQGLTNAAAARSHLEGHMASIQSQNNSLIHREDGVLEARVSIGEWELRHTGKQSEGFTVRGYAAVFNQLSLDLGGFREQIDPTAFDEVLETNPDVHFVWDHDTRYVGARTKNGTLRLSSDNTGLGFEAQVGNYAWARDLRIALERGDIDQGSFAFSIADGGDEWEVAEDESVLRTIRKVGGLYDVTVTAQGAYPQTSVAAVRSLIKAATGTDPLENVVPMPVVGEGGRSSQKGEQQDNEEFARWKVAMETKFAAARSTLAKNAERLERLKDGS